MNANKGNLIKINNFNIATILLYDGYELIDLEKDPSDQRRYFFVFTSNEFTETLISSFWTKELRVEPLRFLETQRYLKSRLHSQD